MIAMAEGTRRAMLPHLRKWREWRGLSQRELEERAGVTHVTISHIENGLGANWRTVGRLAQGLGISREQLLHEEPK